jgi:hypothetical protein
MDLLRRLFRNVNIITPDSPSRDEIESSVELALLLCYRKDEKKLLKHWFEIYQKRFSMKERKWIHLVEKMMLKDISTQNGVPTPIKGYIWLECTGASELLSDEYTSYMFSRLLSMKSKWDYQIAIDVPRTLFQHPDFSCDDNSDTISFSKKQQNLFNVLKVYALYDPYIGYVQGLNYIVGYLLTVIDNEQAVYCMLIKLCKNYGIREIFQPGFPLLHEKTYIFNELFKSRNQKLATFLEQKDVDITICIHKWFLTLFTMQFPLDFVGKIWDVFIVRGWSSMYCIALLILQQLTDTIINMTSFEQIMKILLGSFETDLRGINVNAVIQDTFKINIDKQVLMLTKQYRDILSQPEAGNT